MATAQLILPDGSLSVAGLLVSDLQIQLRREHEHNLGYKVVLGDVLAPQVVLQAYWDRLMQTSGGGPLQLAVPKAVIYDQVGNEIRADCSVRLDDIRLHDSSLSVTTIASFQLQRAVHLYARSVSVTTVETPDDEFAGLARAPFEAKHHKAGLAEEAFLTKAEAEAYILGVRRADAIDVKVGKPFLRFTCDSGQPRFRWVVRMGSSYESRRFRGAVMKATLHYYCFKDALSDPDQRRAYEEMVAKIDANCPAARGRWMECISINKDRACYKNESVEVTLDTTHIFENQWNSDKDRIFDWYEEAIFIDGRENNRLKVGHWLELTAELAVLRLSTKKCGYCGKLYGANYLQETPDQRGFCLSCLGSEYLHDGELRLLRLHPLVGEFASKRAELTEEERAWLLPEYVRRQIHATRPKLQLLREELEKEYAKKLSELAVTYGGGKERIDTEYQGMFWLLDRNINPVDVIYYQHDYRFRFGWRSNGLSQCVVDELLPLIKDFPYRYEVKVFVSPYDRKGKLITSESLKPKEPASEERKVDAD